jgi:nucleotide-binding universal stress UspA family protein
MSWPDDILHRIACAVDGSETSMRAAETAIALAAASRAELVFIHVLDDDLIRDFATVMENDGDEARQRLRRSADQMLGHVAELAAKAGVSAKCRLETGDPPRTIDAVAREIGADVIVMGKVGHRGVRKWLVGSVTRRLIESTRVPVLVLAGPGEPPRQEPAA